MPERTTLPSLEEAVAMTSTVCSPPLIYQRLTEAINHPRSSIKDIGRIISEDQGLTARLLRLANSPMFGYFSKVDSIDKALTIIGTRQVRDLALAVSVMAGFTGIPTELLSVASFWRHSVACGIFSRNLAVYLREPNVERYFVAGILHDIGQLVLCTSLAKVASELIHDSRQAGDVFWTTEGRVLGYDHAELGSELLRSWKIPPNIIEPVARHHAPQLARKYPRETAVVHLADILCHALELGASCEWCVPPLDAPAWEQLGLPVSVLGQLVKQSEPHLEETFAILAEVP